MKELKNYELVDEDTPDIIGVSVLESCDCEKEHWGSSCNRSCPDCFSGACEMSRGHGGSHRCSSCGQAF